MRTRQPDDRPRPERPERPERSAVVMHDGAALAAMPRTHFIDRLRVVLTVLVIAHHAAITYGASGGWFYREVRDAAAPASLVLTVLTAVNQAFFMGLFFLIAGYFTPGAWRRKGTARFVVERLLRLGLALLVFGFVLGPLCVALAGLPTGQAVLPRWFALMREGAFVMGPLWFALALLLFTAGWLAWRWLRPLEAAGASNRPLPRGRAWFVAALAVGAAALLLRQWVPVGSTALGLQLGYFASYVFLFALGCRAAGGRWLERVPREQARAWGWVSLLALPVLFVAVALAGSGGRPVDVNGGFSLPAVVYAFWEPFVAWGVIALLLYRFRIHFNQPAGRWRRWSAQAYGAFIVHAPVLVALSVLAADWQAPALLKFAAVTLASVLVSFALAGALRRLPGATRVL